MPVFEFAQALLLSLRAALKNFAKAAETAGLAVAGEPAIKRQGAGTKHDERGKKKHP